MALTPFLDLIQNHLDTYGQVNLTNLANNPMNNQTNNLAKKGNLKMATIHVTDRNGTAHEIEAKEGWKLMEVIRDKGLPIEAACGGCASCATCHVYLDDGWFDKVPAMGEEEEDMLDSGHGCSGKFSPILPN